MSNFLPDFSDKVTRMARMRALSKIRSGELRRGLYVRRDSPTKTALVVPHFWATYVHDGRGPVYPRNSSLLICFRNRKNDPRLINGHTPQRLSQTRRLSKTEFKYWSGVNRRIIKEYRRRTGKRILTGFDYEAMKLPMIVAKQSPRSGSFIPGQFFFANEPGGGMHGFKTQVGLEAKTDTSDYVRARLQKAGFWNTEKKITVRV